MDGKIIKLSRKKLKEFKHSNNHNKLSIFLQEKNKTQYFFVDKKERYLELSLYFYKDIIQIIEEYLELPCVRIVDIQFILNLNLISFSLLYEKKKILQPIFIINNRNNKEQFYAFCNKLRKNYNKIHLFYYLRMSIRVSFELIINKDKISTVSYIPLQHLNGKIIMPITRNDRIIEEPISLSDYNYLRDNFFNLEKQIKLMTSPKYKK